MTLDADELQKIMAEANAQQSAVETDGLIHIGKVDLPKELPVFDDEFYKWKREYWANQIKERKIKNIVAPMVDQRLVFKEIF